MPFKLSKKVKQYDLVSLRGDKIIRAGKRTGRILGVWTDYYDLRIFTEPHGPLVSVHIPSGVVVSGPMRVNYTVKKP